MTDHEPVNIMGVFAFPNPDRDNRMIRFIDSEYNTLFTVKDGERIVLTNLDDQTEILACTYIDDCHTMLPLLSASMIISTLSSIRAYAFRDPIRSSGLVQITLAATTGARSGMPPRRPLSLLRSSP